LSSSFINVFASELLFTRSNIRNLTCWFNSYHTHI